MQIHIDLGPWCLLLQGHCGPKVVHHEDEEEGVHVVDAVADHDLMGFQPYDEPDDRA